MNTTLSRRDFLGGSKLSSPVIMRPPSAVVRDIFTERCDGCADCITACPQGILRLDGGFPLIDFTRGHGECTFCGDCTAACPTGALSDDEARAWRWRADIGANCLSNRGTTCRVCADACEPRAIRFRPIGAGREVGTVDEAACTGCGACASICPASAVRFQQSAIRPVEMTA